MTSPPIDFEGLLRGLLDADVDFILVGGVAGSVHGAARVTFDLDVVYRRSSGNLERLVRALAPVEPYLRAAPPGLPFIFDVGTLQRGSNFKLTTTRGDLTLLGDIAGGGTYDDLLPMTETVEIRGRACRCVTLTALIRLRRAAGRPKDFEAVAELEALKEETDAER